MADAPRITLEDVEVRYRTKGGALTALESITLDIPPRSFVSVVGPSGCGKTTLLKIVSGILRPTRGEVRLDGRPLGAVKLEGQFGFVFQRPLLLPWRTALDNVALSSEIVQKGVPRQERLAEARRWLALTGLGGFEARRPHELSGGMQQRVALSRALAFHPRVLLMDEPFAALDEITRETMQGELLKIWAHIENTILFITHSISEAVLLSERVVILTARPGRVQEILDIPFARPRTEALRGQREFTEIVEYIRGKLRVSDPVGAHGGSR
jgi:NitT/TauT family transport system ATP-binding protein